MRYCLSMTLSDVPASRVEHSAFWFLLMRPFLYPSETGAELLYETMLPYLASAPVLCAIEDFGLEFRERPRGSDTSYGMLVFEAIHNAFRLAGEDAGAAVARRTHPSHRRRKSSRG